MAGIMRKITPVLSLILAVAVFMSFPFVSHAHVHTSGVLSFANTNTPNIIPLSFFGNYAADGSDRDAFIPYAYRGNVIIPLHFFKGSDNYNYIRGNLSFYFTLSTSTQVTGGTVGFIHAAISETSLPEGMTVQLLPHNYSPGSCTYRLNVSFDNVPVYNTYTYCAIMLDINTYVTASAHNFGASYSYLNVQYMPSDYTEWLYFATDFTDFDKMGSLVSAGFDDVTSGLNAINSSVGVVDSSVNGFKQEFISRIGKLATMLGATNDHLSDIYALNTNNSKREIEAAGNNSQNEISTANKNADDIMHSYDSGSQEEGNRLFDESQKQLQETEDSLFGTATGYFDAIDFSSYLSSITTIASSLSFVSSLLQQMYIKSGPFGIVVTVSMVVLIASKIIGLYRFSTGDGGG